MSSGGLLANHLKTDIDSSLTEAKGWDNLWQKHFAKYQGDVRHAYYIAAVRRRHERRLLEIGAGSFRDVAALNRWGVFCEGVDFSSESVERARKIQPTFTDRIKKMDAACLDYPDGAFDLTYHNGFWVLFDDARISELAAEQARVTCSRMIATVHNAHNRPFRSKFAEWGKTDPLYRIRFFYADEVASLMKRLCRHVTVLPVTGGMTDRLIRLGLGPNPVCWAYRLYGRNQRFGKFERLMCIGELAG